MYLRPWTGVGFVRRVPCAGGGTINLRVSRLKSPHSLNHRGKGRVGLHSDEKGGDALLDWYLRRGMTVLPADRRLPPGPRRLVSPSDGRYCYYTVESAVKASPSLDDLR